MSTNTLAPTPIAEVVQIQLTQEESEFAQRLLSREDKDPSQEEIPLTKTARFLSYPGLEMDIKCVNADAPYVDPVIFFDGQEVQSFECAEELEGEYQFEFRGKTYRVEIVPFQK